MNNNNYNNFAFISYSHKDMAVAKWLQKNLEGFKLPTEVHNDIEVQSRYLRPIFRDQSDLNTGILGDELRKHLEQSKFLILICSKNSSQSAWVSDEAKAFVEMGRLDRIIPVIIPDGATDEHELFPVFLREYFAKNPDLELLGVNIGEVGKDKALIRVVSRMLNVSFDTLWKRHLRQKRMRIASISATALILAVMTYLFAIPVNVSVQVYLQKANLPVGTDVVLTIDGAEYTAPLSEPKFSGIKLPGYRRFSDNKLTVSSKFFNSIDTIVSTGFGTQRSIDLNMTRDDSFADFDGWVFDEDMIPLSDVEVEVAGIKSTTDEKGQFQIKVPLSQQRAELPIRLSKTGYATIDREDETPGKELKFIMHK